MNIGDIVVVTRDGPGLQCVYPGYRIGVVWDVQGPAYDVLLVGFARVFYDESQLELAEGMMKPDALTEALKVL